MAVCAITGKRWMNGSKVSHSNIKSPKRFGANIQEKRIWDVEGRRWVRLKISAKGLKVLNKKGLREALKQRR
jgi:large subunit ribosomal protein L28